MAWPIPYLSMKGMRCQVPLAVLTSPAAILPITSWRSSQREATASSPQLRGRSCETSRKNFVTSPWTSTRKWSRPPTPPRWRKATNFRMDRSSISEMSVSGHRKRCSSRASLEWNAAEYMNSITTASWNVILTFVGISSRIPFCPAVPLCSRVFPIVFRKRSLNWPPLKWRLKSCPHQRENTQFGSEGPFYHPWPLSNRCGSPRLSMTREVRA